MVLSSINGYPQLKAVLLRLDTFGQLLPLAPPDEALNQHTAQPSSAPICSPEILISCALQYQTELKQFAYSKDRGAWKPEACILELSQAVGALFF